MLAALAAVVPVQASSSASYAQTPCDPESVRREADAGRDAVVAAVDAAQARESWNRVLDCGGAIAWPATLYNVDGRAAFVFTFDRTALRVYRTEAAEPEAVVPWADVREIEAGNWVIWFRMRTPVEIRSDRGKRKRVKELKVFLHGGGGGDLTYYYNLKYAGRHWFWGTPVYKVENLRGIAVGPTDYQRRVQGFLAMMFDPQGRIALKRKGRGAGW
ncbi:MAG TPA: hypothetical protein VK886_22070 [Vicinamibacterales bacterium]|nr:hypothetical protein [Vicinamibacterales bacterium]